MIEESGRVVEVEGDRVWVETIRTTACDTCKAQKGCGHGLINKASPGNTFRLDVDRAGHEVNVGDVAVIGIPEDSLIKASLISYLMPIVFLISGATLGKLWLGETASVILGLLGLAAGFWAVKFMGSSQSIAQSPILLSVSSNIDEPIS